jgi:hypothetical protein
MSETDYNMSLYPSKYHGYWKPNGRINLYIGTIWNRLVDEHPDYDDDDKFDEFIDQLSNVTLIETLCYYRGKEKLKMKNKCKPYCKVARVCNYLVFPDGWDGIKAFYKKVDAGEL